MKTLYVGVDVDDQAFHVAGIEGGTGEVLEAKTKPTVGSLVRILQKWREKGFEPKVFYESTYIGFSLCRELRARGFHCAVVAASLIPGRSRKDKKTDRLDTLKLSEYAAKGMLREVYVPEEADEAERDLIRSRGFMVDQRRRLQGHLLSKCRRYGLNYRQSQHLPCAKYWTAAHREWLFAAVKEKKLRSLERAVQQLWSYIETMDRWMEQFEDEIRKLSYEDKYVQDVQALEAFRGIDRLGAMTLRSEIGDITRFSHPRQLVSWAGFDIAEYSSGGKERKRGITKMGNRFVRTLLIEAAQTAKRPKQIGRLLARRRKGCCVEQIEIADRCMDRLYRKSWHLLNRGKHHNVIKTACAREMLGFVWGTLMRESHLRENANPEGRESGKGVCA